MAGDPEPARAAALGVEGTLRRADLVALGQVRLVKPGIGGAQAIARFEVERTLLAKPGAAAILRSRDAEFIPKHPKKRHFRFDVQVVSLAVDSQSHRECSSSWENDGWRRSGLQEFPTYWQS